MGIILMPENLRSKLGEEATKELASLINDSTEAVKKQVLDTAMDRFERRLVEVKTDLEKQIADVKADLLKWMFAFWVGQVMVIFTLLSYMLNK